MPICHKPDGVSLSEVTRFSSIEKPLTCINPADYCPHKCSCRSRKRGFIGDCSRKALSEISPVLTKPGSPVVHLKLDSNEILEIITFKNQERLRSIDLSFNKIKTVKKSSFVDLAEIQTILLANNEISCIEEGAFSNNPKLRTVSFGNNKLVVLDELIWLGSPRLAHLTLNGNRWRCNECRMSWFFDRLSDDSSFESGMANCQNGKSLIHYMYNNDVVQCNSYSDSPGKTCDVDAKDEVSGKNTGENARIDNFENFEEFKEISVVADDPNPCHRHSCENQSDCKARSGGGYYCICKSGFSGEFCEQLIGIRFKSRSSEKTQLPFSKESGGGYLNFHNVEIFKSFPLEINMTLTTLKGGGTLMYWSTEHEHIGLEVYSGRVRLSLRSPEAQSFTVYSTQEVDDGNKHVVSINIRENNATLSVDSKPPRIVKITSKNKRSRIPRQNGSLNGQNDHRSHFTDSAENYLNQEYLNDEVSRGVSRRIQHTLWIGGLSDVVSSEARESWYLRNGSSFSGCLSDIKFGEQVLDLSQASVNEKAEPCEVCDSCAPGGFCSGEKDHCECYSAYAGNICADQMPKPVPTLPDVISGKSPENSPSNPSPKTRKQCTPDINNSRCKNGLCITITSSFNQCRCAKGWTGKKCNREVVDSMSPLGFSPIIAPGPNLVPDKLQRCEGKKIKQKIQEYKNDAKCTSKREFRTKICSCRTGGPCCQASKTKKRRIMLYCDDGNKFRVTRLKVENCGCRGKNCLGG